MANGDNRIRWNYVKDVAQILIYPILLGMLYLLLQSSTLDRRLAIIEAKPAVDTALIQKIAVMEDRQNTVIRTIAENGGKMDRIENMLMMHNDQFVPKRR